MRAILPGRPPPKQQALCTALWDGLRIIVSTLSELHQQRTDATRPAQAYVSGTAVVILGGPQEILQTIYIDDVESLEAITIEETFGTIAVCGGQNVYIYEPFGRAEDVLKVRHRARLQGSLS